MVNIYKDHKTKLIFQHFNHNLLQLGYSMVKITIFNKESRCQIMIERLDGKYITITDCKKVSNLIKDNNKFQQKILEISSPGINPPLTTPKRFSQNIGKDITCKLYNGKKISGRLISSNEKQFIIQKDKRHILKKFTDVDEAYSKYKCNS